MLAHSVSRVACSRRVQVEHYLLRRQLLLLLLLLKHGFIYSFIHSNIHFERAEAQKTEAIDMTAAAAAATDLTAAGVRN